MSISDLHLPDLSDVSFSFQIPTDSGHDLSAATPTTSFGSRGQLRPDPLKKRRNHFFRRRDLIHKTVRSPTSPRECPRWFPATIGKPKAVAAEKATPLAESLPGTCTMSVAEPVLKRAQSNATSNENSISKAQPAMNNVPSANVAQSDADPAPVVKPPASTEKMEDAPHPASAAEAIAKPLTKSKKTILSGRHLQRNR
ncbi:hypothetical protein B0H14DRAFT_2625826 [Mycena olivaceomarginata]|nr:hypothetical protein B0H14DRAFT_2625826 [Mycena olivaceomarginata]